MWFSNFENIPAKAEILPQKNCTHDYCEDDSHRLEHSTKQRSFFVDTPCA